MKPSLLLPTLTESSHGLRLENVSLQVIAEQYGTPTYVYSRKALERAYTDYADALANRNALICYAVKANSNIAILNLFARLGSGFDIVSGGELSRVLAAGGQADKIVFSGVGKTQTEISQALKAGVRCFNIESASELDKIERQAAQLNCRARIAFRVNPNVDPKTHPYISTGLRENKFGVAFDEAFELYQRAARSHHLHIAGIGCHIGSQLLDAGPIVEATEKVIQFVDRLAAHGIRLEHIDLGGGLGIRYEASETPLSISDYISPLIQRFADRNEQLCFEPGRSLVGNAGLLLTRVEYLKHGETKNFAIVDAAMNDLTRPALYGAYHEIVPIQAGNTDTASLQYDVVGPVCESGDFLGRGRLLDIAEGDLLAILSAGAYSMAMSSNYNSRGRAAEIMVDGTNAYLIRERETIESLYALEHVIPDSR